MEGSVAKLRLPKRFPPEMKLDPETVRLGELFLCAQARESFLAFRLYMNPQLIRGWWWEMLATELEDFYYRLIDGERPTLLIGAPPQHGKSDIIVDFLAWCLGHHPEWQSQYASYAETLCLRANGKLQRIFQDPKYLAVFPRMRIKETLTDDLDVTNRPELKTNDDVIGFAKYTLAHENGEVEHVGGGYFRNPTVNGQSTGFGYMLGIIDDPLKGRKEANSPTFRNSTWDWLTETFLSRKHDQAGLVLIMTRWHTDDPAGRFLEKYPKTRIVAFPAVAIKNEYIVKEFPPGSGQRVRVLLRRQGEALFPEWKTLEFLNIQRQGYTISGWEAVYQQSPIIVGGGEFPIENFGPVEGFNRSEIVKSVRYWDKAGTDDGGKYTAGVLMHKMQDGTFIIEDGVEGQWSALPRERRIKQTAISDGKRVTVYVEQEPGSGGKESAEATCRMLAGWKVFPDKVSDSKNARAEPYAAAVQNGLVKCVRPKLGDGQLSWLPSFLQCHEVWPNGPLMDWVDAGAGAFNKLCEPGYDTTLSWVEDDDE